MTSVGACSAICLAVSHRPLSHPWRCYVMSALVRKRSSLEGRLTTQGGRACVYLVCGRILSTEPYRLVQQVRAILLAVTAMHRCAD